MGLLDNISADDNWSSGSDKEYAMLNKWNQYAVDAIRRTGGNNAKDAGNESNGYIDHADGSWLNDSETMVPTMLKACTSTDASYTFQSIWAKAPAAE